MASPLGDYCDLYSDFYGECPVVPTIPPLPGFGPGGSYDRPYVGPSLTYFGGTSIDAPSIDTPWPFPVALGGHTYVIDLKYYARSSVEPFREASDFNAQPGEQSLTNEGAWKRNRHDWSWGAGQAYADDPASSDQRFHASKGIDVWTPRELQLLNDTALAHGTVNTNLDVLTVDGYLYLIDGNGIVHTSDPVAGPYVTATVPAAVVSATTDGTTIYAAVAGTGIYSTAAGSGSAAAMGGAAGTFNADLIGYANGWLLATDGPALSSVDAAGAMTLVHTHPNPAFQWTVIASAPNAIYAAGNAGDHNEIYQIIVDTTTAALAVPVFAGGLPEGETLNTAAYYQGTVLLGTSRGLRLSQVDGAGNLSTAPLIEIGQVAALHSQAEFVWFGWRDYDPSSTGLGRANLGVFTSALVPAYASDLMASTQGQVSGIVTYQGKRYFTVTGAGLYGQTDSLVAQGTLDQGNLTYSIFDPKALMSVELITAPLNGVVGLAIVDDVGIETPLGTATTHESTGLGTTFSGHDILAEQLALQITLKRDQVTTLGPVIRRFSMRALPVPSNVELFTVPIILKETVVVDVGEGQDIGYDVAAEIDFLKNLETSRRPVTYQEGDHAYRVTVRSTQRPQGLDYAWNSDRTAIEGIFEVLLSTLED